MLKCQQDKNYLYNSFFCHRVPSRNARILSEGKSHAYINVPVHYRRVNANYRTTYLYELLSIAKDSVPKDRVLLHLLLCHGQRKVAKSRFLTQTWVVMQQWLCSMRSRDQFSASSIYGITIARIVCTVSKVHCTPTFLTAIDVSVATEIKCTVA